MLYDDIILNRNNKVGFTVCRSGLYWVNDWSVDTERNHLAWEEFAKREIEADGLHISLGKGDRIGMAGCGSEKIRARTLTMLRQIQRLFN